MLTSVLLATFGLTLIENLTAGIIAGCLLAAVSRFSTSLQGLGANLRRSKTARVTEVNLQSALAKLCERSPNQCPSHLGAFARDVMSQGSNLVKS